MAESIVGQLPGMSATAVTEGLFGKFDDAGKIELCGAGDRADGVIGRTVSAAGEATYLKWGIVNVTCAGVIAAEAAVTCAAAGEAAASSTSEVVSARNLQTAGAEGTSVPMLVFGPMGYTTAAG